MAERICHKWSRKRDPFTKCGIDVGLWNRRGTEVAASIRRPLLPLGARWCKRCVPAPLSTEEEKRA